MVPTAVLEAVVHQETPQPELADRVPVDKDMLVERRI